MAILHQADKNDVALSIVIPAYNVGPYISRCLDSLLVSNDASRCELVCVNDGSKDNSLELLQAYADRYPADITLISQDNQGVSAARNAGLEMARGSYIMFVDPDDKLTDGVISNIYRLIDDPSTADVTIFSFSRISRSGDSSLCGFDDATFTPEHFTELLGKLDIFLPPWAKLYRADAIGSTRFDRALPFYEDATFNVDVFASCRSIATSSLAVYEYIINSQSITARYHGDRFWTTLATFRRHLCQALEAMPASDAERQALIDRSDRIFSFDILFNLYSLYRAPNRPKKHRYSRLKAEVGKISQLIPLDSWYGRFGGGIPGVATRLLRIHPRLCHLFLSSIFSAERSFNKLRH